MNEKDLCVETICALNQAITAFHALYALNPNEYWAERLRVLRSMKAKQKNALAELENASAG